MRNATHGAESSAVRAYKYKKRWWRTVANRLNAVCLSQAVQNELAGKKKKKLLGRAPIWYVCVAEPTLLLHLLRRPLLSFSPQCCREALQIHRTSPLRELAQYKGLVFLSSVNSWTLWHNSAQIANTLPLQGALLKTQWHFQFTMINAEPQSEDSRGLSPEN